MREKENKRLINFLLFGMFRDDMEPLETIIGLIAWIIILAILFG